MTYGGDILIQEKGFIDEVIGMVWEGAGVINERS